MPKPLYPQLLPLHLTELLQELGVLLGLRRKVLFREVQGCLDVASPNQLDQPLLLQVEEKLLLRLQDLQRQGGP